MLEHVLSEEGFWADRIELTLHRVRMQWENGRFVPSTAAEVTGTIHLTFADIVAILRRPEFIRSLWPGLDAIARVDLALDNGESDDLVLRGAVEMLGRRFPLSTATNLRIERGKLIISAGKLEGFPLIGALPVQPFDLTLPLGSPGGMTFTKVSTAPGEILLELHGTEFSLR